MKTIMLVGLALLISLPGVASDKTNALTIRGLILETVSIEYEIHLINDDNSCTLIKTDHVFKHYKIVLELGRNYKITFHKGDLSKTLIVNADACGVFPVDVNFTNRDNARLSYDYFKRKYLLKVLSEDNVYDKEISIN